VSRRGLRALAIATGAVAAVACAGPSRPGDVVAGGTPEEAVRSLFALADRDTVPPDDLAVVILPDSLADDPGAALDALESLRGIARLRVVASEPLDGPDRVAVDVEGERPGPSLAAFSVQVVRLADGTWRVVWFAGPDVEWPRHARPRDEGLASSAPPSD